jgi:hypothetical protein
MPCLMRRGGPKVRWLSTSKTLKIAPPAAKGLSQIDITIFRSADQFPQYGCAAPPIAPSELINAPRKPRELVASKQELHMKCTNSDDIPFPGAAASAAFRRWWCMTTTSGWYSPLQPVALARPTASMSSVAGNSAPGPNTGSNPPMSRRALRRKGHVYALNTPGANK